MSSLSSRFLGSAIVFIALSFTIYYLRDHHVDAEIRIHFPLSFLKEGPELLDPNNTESIWEYYLLENLACGLVRDSAISPTGYEGCLSDHFHQPNIKTWVFRIRNLRWSDGEEVSHHEIQEWISELRSTDKRHVKFLKLVEQIKYDETTRHLTLIFKEPVGTSILHELSLADAGFFPVDYKTTGWKRTLGPYTVDLWNPAIGELKLIANKHSPFYSERMYPKATLFFVEDPQIRAEVFASKRADIVPHTPSADPKLGERLKQTSTQEYVGHPTHIAFFYFNPINSDAVSFEAREAFSGIIHTFQTNFKKAIKEEYGWSVETQMVPQGFDGRLGETTVHKSKIDSSVLPKNLTIALPENYRYFPSFHHWLVTAFQEFGIVLKVEYQNQVSLQPGLFAKLYTFVGNQQNASGSWAFLTSPGGALHPWKHLIESSYQKVFSNQTRDSEGVAIRELHMSVIAQALAVPLTVGSLRYFLSNRVDVSRWNKFDSRLRIYEIRQK